ncbi:MAG TPA: hypothetical protein VJK72_00310 [Candidatus Nanoarchaeia archaeon]|nr:hypothetical protein [Candidatus Nanoarchaeia archaeon]
MAINTWKLWEKLGFKHGEVRASADDDIEAVVTYLKEVHYDVRELLHYFAELKQIRSERRVLTDEEKKIDNLRKQIEIYDRLLLRFEYYTQDADVNAIRVKMVAKFFKEQANKYKLYASLERMKREPRWFFDW